MLDKDLKSKAGKQIRNICPLANARLVQSESLTRGDGAVFSFTPLRKQQGRDILVCVEATTDVAGKEMKASRQPCASMRASV